MINQTKSELLKVNACLRSRIATIETRLSVPLSGKAARLVLNLGARRQAEAALRDSESRYRRLFETAKDGILLLNAESGQIEDVNPFLIQLLGYSRVEFLGKLLWEIGLFQDVATNQAYFRELQDKKYIRYDELPLETKTGQLVEVEFVSNVYRVNGKKVIQCNIRDNTERVETRNKIRKVNEELSALVAKLREHEHEMEMINNMNELLQTCKSQTEAYQVIALAASELFNGQSGGLAILRASGQYLETMVKWGKDSLIDTTFSLDDCWAMRRGHVHEVADPRASVVCQHFIRPPETGYTCIPLVIQGETLGLLYLETPFENNAEHNTSRRQLILTLTEGIKLSLSNLKLREVLRIQATQDPLTGLFNRRYLADTLPRELHRAVRQNRPMTIAMLDIDHFKRFNDTFGHEAGDLVLREVGRVLRENVRQSDIMCRYGGEEFVLVMPDAPLEASCRQLEKIRSRVKVLQVRYGDQLLGTITLSIGIAQSPEHGVVMEELLRASDEAMYVAKAGGRDCVVVYNDGLNHKE